jgi:hypothetical protein
MDRLALEKKFTGAVAGAAVVGSVSRKSGAA